MSQVSLGLYALPEENPAFFEFRIIWLPFCEIHEIYISRNIFIDAILLHKLLHSGELPPLLSPCCELQSTKFPSLQSLINDGIKWRDCSHMLNCCLSFGETVKANVLILIKVICTSRSNAMNTRNIFTTEHRCVTSQAIVYLDVSNQWRHRAWFAVNK